MTPSVQAYVSRRAMLKGGVAAGILSTIAPAGTRAAEAAESPYADPAEPALPQTDMEVSISDTALVIIDPQFFLSPDGVTWGVVGESVTENGTVENISIPAGDGESGEYDNISYDFILYGKNVDQISIVAISPAVIAGARIH